MLMIMRHLLTTHATQMACPPYDYCRPYDQCYQPVQKYDDDCVPNERANDALRDIEILLRNWVNNLQSGSKTVLDNAFTALNAAVVTITGKDNTDVRALISKLETDVLAAINLRLTVLQSTLEKAVTNEFDKLESTDAGILAAIRAQIIATVEFVAAAANAPDLVRDTQFGLQDKIFTELEALNTQLAASGTQASTELLFKLGNALSTEEDNINGAISRLFKEFIKSLKALDLKYAAELKKVLDSARNKLEADLNSVFTTVTQRDSYFIISIVKKIVEYLTGCPQSSNDNLQLILGSALTQPIGA